MDIIYEDVEPNKIFDHFLWRILDKTNTRFFQVFSRVEDCHDINKLTLPVPPADGFHDPEYWLKNRYLKSNRVLMHYARKSI